MLDRLDDECHSYQSVVIFLDIRVSGLFLLCPHLWVQAFNVEFSQPESFLKICSNS